MNNQSYPYIPSEQILPEITLRVLGLAILLTLILAMSNAYLALKIGILASASIPAAILSMGILRLCKNSNILENNLVQTAASAGEAVAGGVVYTMPALILLHYWQHFDYWTNFWVALLGGLLGVFFSIPLRRVLVTHPQLHFPEGTAIAEVLIVGNEHGIGLREMLQGGFIGASLEFLQSGVQLISNHWQLWFQRQGMLFGFGIGFSPTMLGVGYLVGIQVGTSILIGACIGWILGVPLFTHFFPVPFDQLTAQEQVAQLWESKLRFIGVGAMLVAGIWTLVLLLKPFLQSINIAINAVRKHRGVLFHSLPRVEQDLPLPYVLAGIAFLLLGIGWLFYFDLPLISLGLNAYWTWPLLIIALAYILILGFIFCAITGYFSGLVGVTASPGSAIIIAGLLIAAICLRAVLETAGLADVEGSKIAAAVTTIFLGAIITTAAAIANDNIQDLKVGYLVGSTPWKQQVMLMLGVVIAATIIPVVMELLFQVYGIGDVLPSHAADPSSSLPAPPAAIMAAVTQGVFDYNLPWSMIFYGLVIIAIVLLVNRLIIPKRLNLSVLGVAVGMYLPLSTSVPLFIGSAFSYFIKRRLQTAPEFKDNSLLQQHTHVGILIACGMIAGAAVMSILLAIPFLLARNPDVLSLAPANWDYYGKGLGLFTTLILLIWWYGKIFKK